jgi:hypothetical protein
LISAPVYADVIFVMDHSEDQIKAGEDYSTTPIDYVVAQKQQIKDIIKNLGVTLGGNRFVLVHFSDDVVHNPWVDPLSNNQTRPKTGILFGPSDNYDISEMNRRIDAFPEMWLGGSTNLKL